MKVTITAPNDRGIYIALGNAGGAEPLFIDIDKGQKHSTELTSGQVENLKTLMQLPDWIPEISVSFE